MPHDFQGSHRTPQYLDQERRVARHASARATINDTPGLSEDARTELIEILGIEEETEPDEQP